MPAYSVVSMAALKDTITVLAQGHSLYKLSQAYGIAKDGHPPKRGDRYSSAIKRMIENPDAAQWESLRMLLKVLGVDAEAAIAIAASQVRPPVK